MKLLRGETFLLKISYDDWCLLGPLVRFRRLKLKSRAVGRSENPGVNGGDNLPMLRILMMAGACSALPLTCSLVRFRELKLKARP